MKKKLPVLILVLTFLFSNTFSVNAYHRPTDSVVKQRISLGGDLTFILFESNNAMSISDVVYVANYALNKIHVLQESNSGLTELSHTITSPKNTQNMGLPTGINGPLALAINPTGDLYIGNSSVVNPYSIVTNPTSSSYMVNNNTLIPAMDTASMVDERLQAISTIAYNPGVNMLFLSDTNLNRIIVDNPSSPGMGTQLLLNTVANSGIIIDSDAHIAYLANSGSITRVNADTLNAVNLNLPRIDIASSGIAFNPTTKKLFVARTSNAPTSSISFLDQVPIQGSPSMGTNYKVAGIVLSPPTNNVIAFNKSSNKVYIVDHDKNLLIVTDGITNSLIKTYDIHGPKCIAVNPANESAYVGTSTGTLYVLDTEILDQAD